MKEKFRVRRNGVTFNGNIEKDAVVTIRQAYERQAEITDGYFTDTIMIKELIKIEGEK